MCGNNITLVTITRFICPAKNKKPMILHAFNKARFYYDYGHSLA